jgi:hypothetical protein
MPNFLLVEMGWNLGPLDLCLLSSVIYSCEQLYQVVLVLIEATGEGGLGSVSFKHLSHGSHLLKKISPRTYIGKAHTTRMGKESALQGFWGIPFLPGPLLLESGR